MKKNRLGKFSWLLGLMFVVLFGAVTSAQAATSDQSLARVKAKGTLVMGTSPNYPPYEFQINQHGKSKIVGMDIELGKQIAKDLGVKLVVKKLSFDSLLPALTTGKVDMILSGMSPTPARRKSVDFTNIYYTEGEAILINRTDQAKYKTKKSLAGQKVAAETGTLQYNLIKQQMPASKLTGMSSAANLILALKTHKVAAVVKGTASATAYAKNDPSLIAINGHFKTSTAQAGNAIALKKGSTSLKLAINRSLAKVKKHGWIQKKYLKTAGKYLKVNTADTSMWHYRDYFVKGVQYTLLIAIVGIIGGSILGMLLALLRFSVIKPVRWLATAYVEFVRGTPLMVQIMFVYFGIGMIVDVSALVAGMIAIVLNSAAYLSEIIRGGIQAVDPGQTEAAESLGMSKKATLQYVVLPQTVKIIWPSLGNQFINLIKDTSMVSIIGVTELIYQLGIVQADTYRGVAPIGVAMVIYFVICWLLTRVLRYYERRLNHTNTPVA
ncbi:ABC transporter substrate-binding protein/permease [Lactiplantibacillus daowaiensis]|uniref:ABC transporter substrate-binding protein/permease n=1 Tax=Lactiplantibacillus daowaiensis TaxID=2559918 RepID=A0ABW1S050_9LACO|nr:ABC transporter substrate-binding protein/permease [Lactiplantibacillus daowaiensis]